MDLHFVLDSMQRTGYPIPEYVNYKRKIAADSVGGFRDGVLDSRENVWLSAITLACTPLRPLEKEIRTRKIAAAAQRYGIRPEIDEAVAFAGRLENRRDGIQTRADFRKAADWLHRYADSLAPEVRASLATHLLEQSVKVGYLPSLAEKYDWDEWAGRDPHTDQLRELAEMNLHKLATGNVYRTDQFVPLNADEMRECLPDLLKTASLGMDVIQPQRVGKFAAMLPEREAEILERLLESHGQFPVHSDFGAPVEIDDRVLATL